MTDSSRGRFLIGTSPAPWTRHALTLLAVVWLNIAVQPCVMAMVPDAGAPEAHHCPHCPPAQHRPVGNLNEDADHSGKVMTGHQGHGSTTGASEAAGSALSTPTSCLDTSGDCGDFGRMAPDGRGADLKVKPSPELVYLVPAWPTVVTHRPSELPARWRILSYLPGPPPALNCLHCVYLK